MKKNLFDAATYVEEGKTAAERKKRYIATTAPISEVKGAATASISEVNIPVV